VPLPFVFDLDYTYEFKGTKRVSINQLGPSLSKRQATGQVSFRGETPPPPPPDAPPEVRKKFYDNVMEQPPPCILFRGTGARISQFEKDSYPPELVVLWQPKAWVDRPVACEWAKKCLRKVCSSHKLCRLPLPLPLLPVCLLVFGLQVVEADIAAGVADESTRYLHIQDNLDSQKQPEYLKICSDECQADDHKAPHPV
jgi:hypothetical protein